MCTTRTPRLVGFPTSWVETMIPSAPCMRNGIDCDKRHVGCQSKCDAYKAFRAAIDKANAERHKEDVSKQYASDMIWRDRQKLKYTADGRRVLGQR